MASRCAADDVASPQFADLGVARKGGHRPLFLAQQGRFNRDFLSLGHVNATEAVRTKLDVRDFNPQPVPKEVKAAVLEAGRLTQSGVNSQHWRFILVQNPQNLKRLAEDSTSGGWVSGAGFAVIICTDPKKGYHLLDAGRAAQDMQLTAWDHGVASGLYTGVRQSEMRRDFGIPEDLTATAVVAFGYPARKLLGKKKRKSLSEVAFLEKYGNSLDGLGR